MWRNMGNFTTKLKKKGNFTTKCEETWVTSSQNFKKKTSNFTTKCENNTSNCTAEIKDNFITEIHFCVMTTYGTLLCVGVFIALLFRQIKILSVVIHRSLLWFTAIFSEIWTAYRIRNIWTFSCRLCYL